MTLVELEIGTRQWSELRCGCGQSGAHLADELLRLARREDEDPHGALGLAGHAFSDVVLFEPAPAVVGVALAALADRPSAVSRARFLDLLLSLVAGEGTAEEVAREGRDLEEESIAACRNGLWLLYAEVFAGESADLATRAFEVLTVIEDDRGRLERACDVAGDAIAWYAKPPYQEL
ncbi:hypothetical protein LN042_20240 [Kitasatospora sp. RB6PN24]|uniref:hypothetical protein n=1 Tax=Kitasatospora humi TaxID=2893891 RepID=UPI001E45229A|nr:hypothetical protein [Kitasatospora humi]MCC9309382.1 hypothetical protein [Kitasatospora humi]